MAIALTARFWLLNCDCKCAGYPANELSALEGGNLWGFPDQPNSRPRLANANSSAISDQLQCVARVAVPDCYTPLDCLLSSSRAGERMCANVQNDETSAVFRDGGVPRIVDHIVFGGSTEI